MRIAAMKRREPFEEVFIKTVETALATLFEMPFRATSASQVGRGQLWRCQSLLSTYFVHPVNARPAKYLRDSFRHTPVRARVVPQWLLGTALGNANILRLASHSGFRVEPHAPGAEERLITPGNQRIRLFDFATQTCRVVRKEGFDDATLRREVSLRQGDAAQDTDWIPQIRCDKPGEWFEEPLLDAVPLPRCPPRLSRTKQSLRALSLMESWLERHKEDCPTDVYVDSLVARVREAADAVSARWPGHYYGGLPRSIDLLMTAATKLRGLSTSLTHGDFQPGNILVDRSNLHLWIIDWEHAGRRFLHYDRFVLGLSSRSGDRVLERLARFVAGESSYWCERLPRDYSWRSAMAALFLLEELDFYLRESTTGPYLEPPNGLNIIKRTLDDVDDVQRVLRGQRPHKSGLRIFL